MKSVVKELGDYLCENDYPIDKNLVLKIKELLKKEREQIIEAYDMGYKACDLDEALEINKTMFSGDRYYNNTYNQNK
jgi:hypothetical protein